MMYDTERAHITHTSHGSQQYEHKAQHGTRKKHFGGCPHSTSPPRPLSLLYSSLFFSVLLCSSLFFSVLSLLTSVKVPRSRFTSTGAAIAREEFHALVPTALQPRAVRAVRLGGGRVCRAGNVEGLKGYHGRRIAGMEARW